MFEYVIISATFIFLFLFYHIVVKIYLAAWRFNQMDPSLKTFITPFFGLQRVFKEISPNLEILIVSWKS